MTRRNPDFVPGTIAIFEGDGTNPLWYGKALYYRADGRVYVEHHGPRQVLAIIPPNGVSDFEDAYKKIMEEYEAVYYSRTEASCGQPNKTKPRIFGCCKRFCAYRRVRAMSYDVGVYLPAGRDPDDYDGWLKCDTLNYTSNMSYMWNEAGAPFREWDGKRVSEVLPLLREAIAKIEDDPSPWIPREPTNGWGSVKNALQFMRDVQVMFARYPNALVYVSY